MEGNGGFICSDLGSFLKHVVIKNQNKIKQEVESAKHLKFISGRSALVLRGLSNPQRALHFFFFLSCTRLPRGKVACRYIRERSEGE